jgi:putative transposase
VKAIAQTLGVSRSAVQERMKGRSRPRGPYRKVDDAVVLPLITALVSARPTYGYRRINALLNRQMRESGAAPINRKLVYRIMKANHFLLARKYEIPPDYGHERKVVTMRSNLRWCSDGFEFHCWRAISCAAPSSLMRTIGRSSAGALWSTQGSADRMCAT